MIRYPSPTSNLSCCGHSFRLQQFIKTMLLIFLTSTSVFMTVQSFQPAVMMPLIRSNIFLRRDNLNERYKRNKHHDKLTGLCSHDENNPSDVSKSCDKQIVTNKIHSDNAGFTRRSLFSRSIGVSSAFGMALTILEQPLSANPMETISSVSASTTNTVASNANTMASNAMLIPYSSVRQQKVVTLANGLQVLLVNDKLTSQSKAALVVNGAGQFTAPGDLPGLAHLMEHMVLSVNSDSNFSGKKGDLEEWLSDNEGASNAFTAYENTCFHFNCPHIIFPRALERFACLFEEAQVVSTCKNSRVLAREIRRVDSELDLKNTFSQLEFVTKSFVNPEHPYSKNGRGNLESLETNVRDINVGERLIQFFRQRYLPSRAVLVVVSNQQDLSSIERWVSPFSNTLSKKKQIPLENHFPGRLLRGRRRKHLILLDKNPASSGLNNEKLVIQWVLNEDYRGIRKTNAVEIAFVLNQILGRRGPGSLYLYLRKQGWIQNGSTVPLQVKVPINVSGFQILKLELSLSSEGFLNRSRVVASIYDFIEVLRTPGTESFLIPRDIMAQYATTAKLFGYTLAPRPPDAVELAMDSIYYGVSTVRSGKWYRFPSTEDLGGLGLNRMRRAVSLALSTISDPEDALIIVTATQNTIALSQRSPAIQPIAPLSSSKWKTEKVTGAQVYFEDMLQTDPWTGQKFLYPNVVNLLGDFTSPVYNPLVLTSVRPPRPSNMIFQNPSSKRNDEYWSSRSDQFRRSTWSILAPGKRRMSLPRAPPETNNLCIFVLQLLSSRPVRATAEQAARAELWRLSFDESAIDLAELGAPGGLAYELQFNKYGLRMSFLGLSKTIPSYARRLARRLVRQQRNLLKAPKSLPKTIISSGLSNINRSREMSPSRRRIAIETTQKSKSYDIALEGIAFLDSCKGAVCFSEGDFTTSETENLLDDLRDILDSSIGGNRADEPQQFVAIPSVDELTNTPIWKPRNAVPCYIAGMSLMSDACGRITR